MGWWLCAPQLLPYLLSQGTAVVSRASSLRVLRKFKKEALLRGMLVGCLPLTTRIRPPVRYLRGIYFLVTNVQLCSHKHYIQHYGKPFTFPEQMWQERPPSSDQKHRNAVAHRTFIPVCPEGPPQLQNPGLGSGSRQKSKVSTR